MSKPTKLTLVQLSSLHGRNAENVKERQYRQPEMYSLGSKVPEKCNLYQPKGNGL